MQLQWVHLPSNKNELILRWSSPGFRVNAAALAAELKNMALLLSLEPENAFGPKDIDGHLSHQKVLEFGQVKRAIALKGHRDKTILGEMSGWPV